MRAKINTRFFIFFFSAIKFHLRKIILVRMFAAFLRLVEAYGENNKINSINFIVTIVINSLHELFLRRQEKFHHIFYHQHGGEREQKIVNYTIRHLKLIKTTAFRCSSDIHFSLRIRRRNLLWNQHPIRVNVGWEENISPDADNKYPQLGMM